MSQFPKEIGISNIDEHSNIQKLDYKVKSFNKTNLKDEEIKSLYLNENFIDLDHQVDGTLKKDISLLILGSLGKSLSQMICGCTALRILHEKLSKKFKSVKIDIYLNASENKYYSRDKMLFNNQNFINKVTALSLDVKEFCDYDFFIDVSSVTNRSFFKDLPLIDSWLYKFGIDYKKIDLNNKYNTINISNYKPKKELKEKLEKLKLKGKLLLFHPFSANINKSIPKEVAVKFLKELIKKLPDYIIISTTTIDAKIDDDSYFDLSKYSQNILDFSYIISNMNKIITVNTASYHIADAFFIPTIVILVGANENENIQLYPNSKVIFIEDKSKNLSKFIFENESLVFHRFKGFEKLKSNKIIKLLETF